MRWIEAGGLALIAFSTVLSSHAADFGRTPTKDEVALWDIDVRPDGQGLPSGKGSVTDGRAIYVARCMACHGANGEGGLADRLVGGQGSLATAQPVKTVGSYWEYATTLFDYIRRAMPYPAPGTLTSDETYAVAAYILFMNHILQESDVLDEKTILTVKMPNREGFVPDAVFKLY